LTPIVYVNLAEKAWNLAAEAKKGNHDYGGRTYPQGAFAGQ